ncbi:MAG: rRNA maturation RNase YbeY [Bacteroidota bacterium]
MIKNIHVYSNRNLRINNAAVHKIISTIKKEYELNIKSLEINFVPSKIIHEINKKYLDHDYTTDVISFNYSNESNNLDGEIFICSEIADENAKYFKVSLDNELKRLVIHGILHLIGYDDLSRNDKLKMRNVENRLLNNIRSVGKVIRK